MQENGQSRLQQVQKDVDDVKVIMLDNLNKATEREGKLGDLEDRADVLLQEVKLVQKSRHFIFISYGILYVEYVLNSADVLTYFHLEKQQSMSTLS
uniref:V-SNARE coiled-coil homology domain-containing protein n=1 Tax=Pygocentrus nattereri TaxID=42514 RepID=A0AAR2LXV2_PYGNA